MSGQKRHSQLLKSRERRFKYLRILYLQKSKAKRLSANHNTTGGVVKNTTKTVNLSVQDMQKVQIGYRNGTVNPNRVLGYTIG